MKSDQSKFGNLATLLKLAVFGELEKITLRVFRIATLLNSSVGKYLSDHPFLTLVLLVFGVTASVPIGLFLVFSAVTFITVTAYCIFVEIFLLTVGGAILLGVLCCLAVVALWISCVLSILYIVASHVLNYSFIPSRVAEKTGGDMETEKDLKDQVEIQSLHYDCTSPSTFTS